MDANEQILNEVKTIATETKSGIAAVETKAAADLAKLQEQFDALEAKANRMGLGGEVATKNHFHAAFEAKSEAIKNYQHGDNVVIELDKKAVVDMFSSVAGIVADNRGFLAKPSALTNLRDVIGAGNTISNAITYVQEKGFYGAPAMTGEGALKSKVSLDFETKTEAVKKLTAYFKVSEELKADAPAMLSYIQGRVVEELKAVENLQLAFGDGNGVNLRGFMGSAQAFNANGKKVKDAQLMDVLRLAILQVRKAKYAANAIVLNPADVAEMDLTKDADGNYLLGSLFANSTPSLRGVRIIEQDVMPEGQFAVGAFDKAVQIYDREGITIRLYDQNEDDAIKNMITVVIEERLAQVVYRPEAIVKGTFADAIASLA